MKKNIIFIFSVLLLSSGYALADKGFKVVNPMMEHDVYIYSDYGSEKPLLVKNLKEAPKTGTLPFCGTEGGSRYIYWKVGDKWYKTNKPYSYPDIFTVDKGGVEYSINQSGLAKKDPNQKAIPISEKEFLAQIKLSSVALKTKAKIQLPPAPKPKPITTTKPLPPTPTTTKPVTITKTLPPTPTITKPVTTTKILPPVQTITKPVTTTKPLPPVQTIKPVTITKPLPPTPTTTKPLPPVTTTTKPLTTAPAPKKTAPSPAPQVSPEGDLPPDIGEFETYKPEKKSSQASVKEETTQAPKVEKKVDPIQNNIMKLAKEKVEARQKEMRGEDVEEDIKGNVVKKPKQFIPDPAKKIVEVKKTKTPIGQQTNVVEQQKELQKPTSMGELIKKGEKTSEMMQKAQKERKELEEKQGESDKW